MINFQKLFQEHHIPYWTEGKNTQHGWTNIQCPVCDDHSNHGGFNNVSGQYNCWKCGSHYYVEILSIILGESHYSVKSILQRYEQSIPVAAKKQRTIPTSLSFPYGTGPLQKQHKQYLENRNYDPDIVESLWKLQGTGHLGDYKFRIIAPVLYEGRVVSYQGRDISGKSPLRYKACSQDNELIAHQDIVYGSEHIRNRTAIIVEGITDAWRMGPGAIATFGTSVTTKQILCIQELIDTAFILFDPEQEAQEQALKVCKLLSAIGVTVENITGIESDPGDLSQDEVKYIKKNLLF